MPETVMQESLTNGQDRIIDVPYTKQAGESASGIETRCDLCGRAGDVEQDHDHRTDLCRGKLCHSCNLLVGRFDRPIAEIQRFLDYLRHWSEQHATGGAQTYTDYMRDLFPKYRRGQRARKTEAA